MKNQHKPFWEFMKDLAIEYSKTYEVKLKNKKTVSAIKSK